MSFASFAASQQWIMLVSEVLIFGGSTLALFLDRSVEDIMLRDENDVKQQTDICQSKFDRVARQPAPVRLQRAVYQQLQHAQQPAAEV